ncbi:RHS repeat-associated core domain-containing protein [Brenneria sp. 4F2]|nr:RHS repeat-associated core domain-containing protein [Brenneria bubanii]
MFWYYDLDCGRFTHSDPIGLAGGINLYQYAPNPLTWIDPLGLSKCDGSRPTKRLPPHVEGEYLYRGIHRGHPDEANALRGRVSPGNPKSKISEEEHNTGEVSANSPFTSWTRDPDIARKFAKEDSVILRVKTGAPKEGASWSWA